ncbi:MAG: ComEA family DNA-binding protein [Proteobacteria bacterium]|nr:ComEA family DNA-binding protein [Pseudomonadota bacterium]OEU83285.1 MAG: hypothetical protein BA865_12895 [Desulfobacterales bacterium S5133MH4]
MRPKKIFFALCLIIAVVMGVVPALLAQETEYVNINAASVEQLTQLKGIGPKIAERVVQYREEHGRFQQAEDITKVQGIGQGIFQQNVERITVE